MSKIVSELPRDMCPKYVASMMGRRQEVFNLTSECCGICVCLLCDTRHRWQLLYVFDHHQTNFLASVKLALGYWACQELTCIRLDLMETLGLQDKGEVFGPNNR